MKKRSSGFTIVEICMVCFILAFLMALSYPVFITARMSAKQTSAISNLRQLGVVMALYRQDHESSGNLGLPDYSWVNYHSAPYFFGETTKLLWMSPCGTHPNLAFLVPKAKTNLLYLASVHSDESFLEAYGKQGESTAYLFDLNCNSSEVAVTDGQFIKKMALALRLDGSVTKRQKYGSPYDPLSW